MYHNAGDFGESECFDFDLRGAPAGDNVETTRCLGKNWYANGSEWLTSRRPVGFLTRFQSVQLGIMQAAFDRTLDHIHDRRKSG